MRRWAVGLGERSAVRAGRWELIGAARDASAIDVQPLSERCGATGEQSIDSRRTIAAGEREWGAVRAYTVLDNGAAWG